MVKVRVDHKMLGRQFFVLIPDQADEQRIVLRSQSEAGTAELGSLLGQSLQAGNVLALVGDLGAGKTRLVQSIAVALGVPETHVNSPTFTLVHEYSAPIPLRHCDTYRLNHPDEFLDLGLDELFGDDGIAVIEWADRVIAYLPHDAMRIEIRITSPTSRQFELLSSGKSSQALLARIRRLLGRGDSN